MANIITKAAFVTFATLAPAFVHAQSAVKKATQKVQPHAYEVVTDTLVKEKPMTYYSTVLAKQPAPKLNYIQELAKSKYGGVITEDQSLITNATYMIGQQDSTFKLIKSSNAIELNAFYPKLFSLKYTPPRFNKTTRQFENRRFVDRGSKEILHIDQGVGLRFSDDTLGGKQSKVIFNTRGESGALIKAGRVYGDYYEPPFKVTLVDDFRGKFQGVFHKNPHGSTLAKDQRFVYRNFAGVNLTGNFGQGRATTKVAGGFLSEKNQPTQPAIMAYANAFIDNSKKVFFFAEALITKNPTQREYRFGAGGRFGGN